MNSRHCGDPILSEAWGEQKEKDIRQRGREVWRCDAVEENLCSEKKEAKNDSCLGAQHFVLGRGNGGGISNPQRKGNPCSRQTKSKKNKVCIYVGTKMKGFR